MKSPTLHDVAQLAGVSYATADRVVNQRGNVAAKSVAKVQTAVTELGYVRNVAAANLSRSRTHRLAFLLPHGRNAFFGRMHDHLADTVNHLKHAQVTIDVTAVDAFKLDALETALAGMGQKHYDGIAIVGLRHDRLMRPLDTLRKQGTRIVSLVSDLPAECRDHYIGIDNTKAGRTAARLMGMAHAGQPGRVAITAGSLDALDHIDRITGFREVMGRDFPMITLLDVGETADQPQLMQRTLGAIWKTHPDLTGLYNAGAANDALASALRILPRPANFCCIVHELVPPTRRALEDGIINVAIDQRPEIEVNRAITLLRALADDLPPPPAPELTPAIYLRDNLPTETSLQQRPAR